MKFLSLHCFRGIACLCVMLYHSDFVLNLEFNPIILHSFLIVDFFFILSGFVIAFSYGDKIISKTVSFKQFISLRLIGRLYPMHFFTLILFVPYIIIKIWIYNNYSIGSDPQLINNFTSFFTNLFMIHGISENMPSCGWNGPSWTMSVELFLYIIFYTLMSKLRAATSFQNGLIFFLFSIFAFAICFYGYSTNYLATYVMLRGLGGFCAGVAVFKIYENPKNRFQFLPSVVFSLIEIMTLSLAIYMIGYGSDIMAIVSLVALVYIFAIQNKGIVSKAITNKYLSKLADWSVSIYMIHFLVVAVFHNFFIYILKFSFILHNDRKFIITEWAYVINLAMIIIVLCLSWLTYNYIETPCRTKVRKLVYG